MICFLSISNTFQKRFYFYPHQKQKKLDSGTYRVIPKEDENFSVDDLHEFSSIP